MKKAEDIFYVICIFVGWFTMLLAALKFINDIFHFA